MYLFFILFDDEKFVKLTSSMQRHEKCPKVSHCILRNWYKVFWQVLVLNTQTNRKFLAIPTDEREREREIHCAYPPLCVCVCFFCVCTIFRFLIACSSARAKKKYQAYKYGTLTQGYGNRWAKGGDILSLDDSGVSCPSERNECLLDMTPVSFMQ